MDFEKPENAWLIYALVLFNEAMKNPNYFDQIDKEQEYHGHCGRVARYQFIDETCQNVHKNDNCNEENYKDKLVIYCKDCCRRDEHGYCPVIDGKPHDRFACILAVKDYEKENKHEPEN